MQYRKKSATGKPVIVEAVQWPGENDHPAVIKLLITPEGTVTEDSIIYAAWEYAIGSLVTLAYAIETPEGLMPLSPGDYIVTGADGSHSLFPPDAFAQTFDPVPLSGAAP